MRESLLFVLDGRQDLAEDIIDSVNLMSNDAEISLGYLNKQKFSDGDAANTLVKVWSPSA